LKLRRLTVLFLLALISLGCLLQTQKLIVCPTGETVSDQSLCPKETAPITQTQPPPKFQSTTTTTTIIPTTSSSTTTTTIAIDFFEISNVSCKIDEDCQLINKDHGFSCCWEGACVPIDYSLDKWIAVNKYWFSEQRAENCPPIDECGPSPMCIPRIINENFKTQCVNKICQKIPITRE
jgi:hypothetical protein